MAIGYALANSIWLEGPEGIVVVDTTESMEAGRAVYNDMRKGIKGPIKAIIYTHSHADHVYGAKVPRWWTSMRLIINGPSSRKIYLGTFFFFIKSD